MINDENVSTFVIILNEIKRLHEEWYPSPPPPNRVQFRGIIIKYFISFLSTISLHEDIIYLINPERGV